MLNRRRSVLGFVVAVVTVAEALPVDAAGGTTSIRFEAAGDVDKVIDVKQVGKAAAGEKHPSVTEATVSPQQFPDAETEARRWGVTASNEQVVTFTTRPLLLPGGGELLIDADAGGSRAYVSVSLLDTQGREIPGYGYVDSQILVGDEADQVVTWNAHRRLPPKPAEVRLRLTLHDATVFAVKTRPAAEPADAPLAVGTRRQLLADPAVVAVLDGGATLKTHPPIDRGVVLTLDRPWEGNTSAYATVFRDGNTYRLYYRGLHHNPGATHPVVACYAESQDGVEWNRPSLRQVEFAGSLDNNILDLGRRGQNSLNFTPFLDTNPACPPEEKLKAIAGEGGAAYGYTSPDGVRWTMIDRPLFGGFPLDSQQTAFFDRESGLYHAYLRVWHRSRTTSGIRGIMVATSEDFRTWLTPRWLTYPGAATIDLYTNNVLEYPRATQLFVGFPCRFVQGQNVEPLFMISRDGMTFKRWDEALIRAGRNPAQWGNRCNYLWYGMVETAGPWEGEREISMYGGEDYYRGDAVKLRRWTWRPDGFVSVNAPYGGGSVTTPELVADGTFLEVNYSTAAGGFLEVEVLDPAGKRVAGSRRMVGDAVAARVPLVNPGKLAGRPLRLRFRLADADLFAFQFVD